MMLKYQHCLCTYHTCMCVPLAFNQFSQSDKEREMFSLAGDENANKRRSLYSFLLTHLIDEHRFQLTAKLCQEVQYIVTCIIHVQCSFAS